MHSNLSQDMYAYYAISLHTIYLYTLFSLILGLLVVYSYEEVHFIGKLLRIRRKRLAFHKLSNAITSTDNSLSTGRLKEADIAVLSPQQTGEASYEWPLRDCLASFCALVSFTVTMSVPTNDKNLLQALRQLWKTFWATCSTPTQIHPIIAIMLFLL